MSKTKNKFVRFMDDLRPLRLSVLHPLHLLEHFDMANGILVGIRAQIVLEHNVLLDRSFPFPDCVCNSFSTVPTVTISKVIYNTSIKWNVKSQEATSGRLDVVGGGWRVEAGNYEK